MPREDTRRTASRFRTCPWAIAVAVSAAIIGAGATDAAEGATFKPVQKGERALIFKPRGVAPDQIDKAQVRVRHRRGRTQRPVSAARVRNALRQRSTLRVRRPRGSKGGSLKVTIKRGGAAPVSLDSCSWGSFSASSIPGACWRPYCDSSPFNTTGRGQAGGLKLGGDRLAADGAFAVPDKITPATADTAGDWSHPIYYSQPTDPLFTVALHRGLGHLRVEGMQVRIPAQRGPPAARRPHGGDRPGARAGSTTSGRSVQARRRRHDLELSWGGRTAIGTADADGLDSNATAAHFGLAAGVIRPSELAAGEIDHALFMVVKCTNGSSVYPAGPGTGSACADKTNAPAMGQHFYLDLSDAQIEALSVPAWQKTILRAMARYGLYVGDTGGSGWGIQFESGSSFTSFGQADPWVALGDQYGVTKWTEPNSGRVLRIWDFGGAVDWSSNLSVAAP